ncbi:MAG: hypothetical protein JNL90_00070 [Planctomycetes bacterium]|nr:hypothetical protein [Planctomycetota bacterium]
MPRPSLLLALSFAAAGCAAERAASTAGTPADGATPAAPPSTRVVVERVTTKVPFPRGLALMGDELLVLCRGRVREYGGVSASVEDQAGTLYKVNPAVGEPFVAGSDPSDAVKENGTLFAAPDPTVFRLWDRTANPPWNDRLTDRPYCGLRYDPRTQNVFLCAFSGIDKKSEPGKSQFSKNLSDALLRYDTRTGKWHEVERHDVEAGGNYPHNDPNLAKPPHGWLNGPDNCLVVGRWLYAVAKDNSRLVRYDLAPIEADPAAGAPPSFFVLDEKVMVEGEGLVEFRGHSALAQRDGQLYIAFRTSSQIVRIPLDAEGLPVQPIVAQRVARFQPYDAATGKSANLTDMAFGPNGDLFVISASPSRVHRFRPDPAQVYDATDPKTPAWLELAQLTGNPKMKSENVLVDPRGRVYVTSGDAYDFQNGAGGVVWRATEQPAGS